MAAPRFQLAPASLPLSSDSLEFDEVIATSTTSNVTISKKISMIDSCKKAALATPPVGHFASR